MDAIGRALKRANDSASLPDLDEVVTRGGAPSRLPDPSRLQRTETPQPETIPLDERLLRRNRIITFEPRSPIGRHYDILRNEISGARHGPGPHVVAVTGAGRRCGATVTAINLAVSFARNRAHRVILVDAVDTDPAVLSLLGAAPHRADPSAMDATTHVQVRDIALRVASVAPHRHEGSDALLPFLSPRPEGDATVIVIDLPPLLTSDRAASCISLAQSVVVVLAEGQTTHAEVESCKTYVRGREGIQFVLNKCGRHGL